MAVELDAPVEALATDADLANMLEGLAAEVITETKPNSMVRMGDKALPERIAVYDERGNRSMIPTAAARYHLTKKNPETGRRAFYLTVPEGVTEPQPIPETCEICTEARGGRPRPFYRKRDLMAHKQYYHPLETAEDRREEDLANRRAEIEAIRGGGSQGNILGAIASMSAEEKAALRALLGGEEPPATPQKRGA